MLWYRLAWKAHQASRNVHHTNVPIDEHSGQAWTIQQHEPWIGLQKRKKDRYSNSTSTISVEEVGKRGAKGRPKHEKPLWPIVL